MDISNGQLVVNLFNQGTIKWTECLDTELMKVINKAGRLMMKNCHFIDIIETFHISSQWDDIAKANDDLRDKTSKPASASQKKQDDDDEDDFDDEDEEEAEAEADEDDSDKEDLWFMIDMHLIFNLILVNKIF